ncbi:hypothetical protein [Leptolyngbya sp. PCC 6406]|uniref:hypothetical protein n=1 Tax=Leptolyngbya sp. PCC 6406 TaxID=1173264 RepID=UPI0002AD0652|nr:hypothetical protein [Leptolyngbya sp. PCC 6406]
MNSRAMSGFAFSSVVLALVLLLVFGLLQWLQVPAGNFLDWVIGTASFWWLLVIVTVPWNIYFDAKGVLAEAAESRRKEITVDMGQVRYVQVVAQRSLWVAIALHGVSALGLYGLAAIGISPIGYISSAAALLLTGLRPAVSFYQYLAMRLSAIRKEVQYPREDVMELRQRVMDMVSQVKDLRYQLNLDQSHSDSWATTQETTLKTLRQDLTNLAAEHRNLMSDNQAAHTQLARDARTAIAQVSEDGRVLENVREIIRFFKSA